MTFIPCFFPIALITVLVSHIPMTLPIIQQITPPIAKVMMYFAWLATISHMQFVIDTIVIIQLKIMVVMLKCFWDGHHLGRLSSEPGNRVVRCCAVLTTELLRAAVINIITKQQIHKNSSIWPPSFVFRFMLVKII